MDHVELLRRPILRRSFLHALQARLAVWSARARERRLLLALDDRSLKDLGLSRADARREAARPFWRG
jgi:uncharacterized protein YjiS (DUF1127 family)